MSLHIKLYETGNSPSSEHVDSDNSNNLSEKAAPLKEIHICVPHYLQSMVILLSLKTEQVKANKRTYLIILN